MTILESILNKNHNEANNLCNSKMHEKVSQYFFQVKKQIVAETFGTIESELEILDEKTTHGVINTQRIGNIKVIKVRIRNSKIQRKKKVSAVKGFKLVNGKLVRLTTQEKLHRKIGSRKGAIARRSKRSQIARKIKLSLRRRKSMGL